MGAVSRTELLKATALMTRSRREKKRERACTKGNTVPLIRRGQRQRSKAIFWRIQMVKYWQVIPGW